MGFGQRSSNPKVMTRENLVTAPAETTLEEAEALLNNARVEKLLLVNQSGHLAGLITMRDIEKVRLHPMACRDERGRLRVGARWASTNTNGLRHWSKPKWMC